MILCITVEGRTKIMYNDITHGNFVQRSGWVPRYATEDASNVCQCPGGCACLIINLPRLECAEYATVLPCYTKVENDFQRPSLFALCELFECRVVAFIHLLPHGLYPCPSLKPSLSVPFTLLPSLDG